MKTIKFILIIILSANMYHTGRAQSAMPEPLQPLALLAGEWSGEGSQSRGQNDRLEFNQTEEVSVELDGRLIVFRGTGTTKGETEPSFRAYGVMTYDSEADQVFIHAWTMDGNYTKAPVETSENQFSWSFDVPNGGKVRYTADFNENTWTERGAYSPDQGKTWYPFMEMRLTR